MKKKLRFYWFCARPRISPRKKGWACEKCEEVSINRVLWYLGSIFKNKTRIYLSIIKNMSIISQKRKRNMNLHIKNVIAKPDRLQYYFRLHSAQRFIFLGPSFYFHQVFISLQSRWKLQILYGL